jgi:hypothetical protein
VELATKEGAENTQYRAGSRPWTAQAKWGWYISMFSAICNPDNMSLQMSPKEYLEMWDTNPRLTAILLHVQAEMRSNVSKKTKNIGK